MLGSRSACEPGCSGRSLSESAFSSQSLPRCQQQRFRNRRRRTNVATSSMQPFSGRIQQPADPRVNQPIIGCMIGQQPLPLGVTRLKDRKSVNGTVLVEQPDASMQHQGQEALEYALTSFHAETKRLPTKYGMVRVRAYRHSVSPQLFWRRSLQHAIFLCSTECTHSYIDSCVSACATITATISIYMPRRVTTARSWHRADGWRQHLHRTHSRINRAARGAERGEAMVQL